MCNCKQREYDWMPVGKPRLLPEIERALQFNDDGGRDSNELESEIIGTDERIYVPDSTIAPFRYICQIRAKVSRAGYTSVGTGFFVGPHTILTAAHNVWDEFISPNGAKVQLANVEIFIARNGENVKPFGSLKPVKIVLPHSDFKNADRGGYKDYAIIHIDSSKENKAGYFGMGRWSKDSIGSADVRASFQLPCPFNCLLLNTAGYPADVGDKKATRLYRSSEVGLKADGRLLAIRNDTYKSMSGSPVWLRRDQRNGGRTVIGILLGAGNKDQNGRYIFNVARYIDDEVRKFVKDNYK